MGKYPKNCTPSVTEVTAEASIRGMLYGGIWGGYTYTLDPSYIKPKALLPRIFMGAQTIGLISLQWTTILATVRGTSFALERVRGKDDWKNMAGGLAGASVLSINHISFPRATLVGSITVLGGMLTYDCWQKHLNRGFHVDHHYQN